MLTGPRPTDGERQLCRGVSGAGLAFSCCSGQMSWERGEAAAGAVPSPQLFARPGEECQLPCQPRGKGDVSQEAHASALVVDSSRLLFPLLFGGLKSYRCPAST